MGYHYIFPVLLPFLSFLSTGKLLGVTVHMVGTMPGTFIHRNSSFISFFIHLRDQPLQRWNLILTLDALGEIWLVIFEAGTPLVQASVIRSTESCCTNMAATLCPCPMWMQTGDWKRAQIKQDNSNLTFSFSNYVKTFYVSSMGCSSEDRCISCPHKLSS